jgi:hypothetical protein
MSIALICILYLKGYAFFAFKKEKTWEMLACIEN